MMGTIIAQIMDKMSVEDRVFSLLPWLCSMFDAEDFDLWLALAEKRYSLTKDEEKKNSQAATIRFVREIASLRPHAKEFQRIVNDKVRNLKKD